MYWLKEQHLAVLLELLPAVENRTKKRLLRECVLGLTQELTAQLTHQATNTYFEEPVAPLREEELTAIQVLMAKGVQHNGLIPELSTGQVGRSLQVLGALLARAHIAFLDLEDQEGLQWIFDTAARVDNGVNEGQVRRVELLVRAALGLEVRLATSLSVNEQMA